MEDRYIEIFRGILGEAIDADDEDYIPILVDSVKTLVKQESETAAVNFTLFVFYTLDKVSLGFVTKGINNEAEKDFLLRLILIEQYLEEVYQKSGYPQLFLRAIETYKTAVNQA